MSEPTMEKKAEDKTESEFTDLLSSQHVRLVPYFRGLGSRETLYHLWRLAENEQANKYITDGTCLSTPVCQNSAATFNPSQYEPVVHYYEDF